MVVVMCGDNPRNIRALSKDARIQKILDTEDGLDGFRFVLLRDLAMDYGDYIPAWVHYARTLRELGRYEEAIHIFNEVIAQCHGKELAFSCRQLGILYRRKGDYEKAAQWFRKSIREKPQDADHHAALARLLTDQEKLEEARQCYETAIECPEGCIDEAYVNLGTVLKFQGRFVEAVECFERALELDPEYGNAMLHLKDVKAAQAYLRLKQVSEMEVLPREERLAECRKLGENGLTSYRLVLARDFIRDHDDYGPAHMQYANALTESARYEGAANAYERAVEFCPHEILYIPYMYMGNLYRIQGDCERAARWFRDSVKARPENAEPHGMLGDLLAKQGNLEEAEQCYLTALECPEGDLDEVYLGLGCVLRSLERFAEALECFQKAFELDPDSEEAELGVKDMKLAIDYLKDNSGPSPKEH